MRHLRGEPSIVVAAWLHLTTIAVAVGPVAAAWPQPTTMPSLTDLSLVLGVAGMRETGSTLTAASHAYGLLLHAIS